MARKTRVVGFSIPPEIDNKLERFIKSKHKTRSEFVREMIDVYFSAIDSSATKASKIDLAENDLAKILKSYWILKSQTHLKLITIGLAIVVNDEGKVLIGARKAKDKWVDNLTWVFPGGNLETLDFSHDVTNEVKQETGLDVKVNSLIASRVHPDSGFKNVQINALYFHCSPINDKKLKVGGELKQLKWVLPTDVFKYFTTSTCDDITKFLMAIQKAQ